MIENNFFEKQTLSSKVKASIVSEYFPKYCKIIIRKHIPKKIGYYDLFSGPGLYDDGNPSTPILIARKCKNDDFLRQKVRMIFNDNHYAEQLKSNFEKEFPVGTFSINPFFGNKTVGESESINAFITKNTMENRINECPAVLFIDPFGYKGIETNVLSQFLTYWGNELFIFINSKRINPALENEKFEQNMRYMFPSSYETLKIQIREKKTVPERLQFIIDNLYKEFKMLTRSELYYTAFKFQEEDSNTTSHFILHLTKSKRGFDLIKQIYNDFANVGTIFDGINTYTFDVKKITNPIQELFDTSSENIDVLKEQIFSKYNAKVISAYDLFEKEQINTLYSRAHYVEALRRLVAENRISSIFNDGKEHRVSVLLLKECLLTFK